MNKLVIILLLIPIAAWTQQLTPDVISSAGGFSTHASGTLSFTVGEMAAVETFTAPASILTQGFQQPWDFGTYVIDYPGAEFSFDVFPNPSGSVVHLYTQSDEQAALNINVTDILGREVFHSELFHSNVLQIHELDLSRVTSGTYFLTLAINRNGTLFKGNHALTIQIIR